MPFFGSVSNYLLFNDLFRQKTPPVPILSLSIFRNKGLLHVKSIQFNNLSLTHLKYTSSHDTSFFLMGLLLMLFALAIERKTSPLMQGAHYPLQFVIGNVLGYSQPRVAAHIRACRQVFCFLISYWFMILFLLYCRLS